MELYQLKCIRLLINWNHKDMHILIHVYVRGGISESSTVQNSYYGTCKTAYNAFWLVQKDYKP